MTYQDLADRRNRKCWKYT